MEVHDRLLVKSPNVDRLELLQLLWFYSHFVHVLSAFRHGPPVDEEGSLPPSVVHGWLLYSIHARVEHLRQPNDQTGVLQDSSDERVPHYRTLDQH